MSRQPAVLGGSPMFETLLPVFSPTLAPYEHVADKVAGLFDSGMLTAGPYVREFEERLAAHLGVKHTIAVSSCTVGLLLTVQALGLEGEALVPSFTFMATVHPLAWNNVTPVFVDVDPETWTIDPAAVEEAITESTTAIVGVHLHGTPAKVELLEAIARRHGLKLLFDAAHGFGALHDGKPLGGYGDAEVFSTSPTKVLTAVDGGIVATDDDDVARRVRTGRNYGNPGNYGSEFPGINARMPEFNAIVGMTSLDLLEENVARRSRATMTYRARLDDIPGTVLQRIPEGDSSSFKQFSFLVEQDEFRLSRDELAAVLKADGIDSRYYYDPPVHQHDAYKHLADGSKTSLPVTEAIAEKTITIPLYSHMDEDTAHKICDVIESAHDNAPKVRAALAAQ